MSSWQEQVLAMSIRQVESGQLVEFIRESNRIEGIVRAPTPEEIQAHIDFLALEAPIVADLERFVACVAGAELRSRAGMNVQVGSHRPPPGGPQIAERLAALLEDAVVSLREEECLAHDCHCQYETLHPFMDGNGRSGRVLWLWMHIHHPAGDRQALARGFLHSFYYETLQAARTWA